MTLSDEWLAMAARFGIEPFYFDVHGRRREADEEALRRLVDCLTAPGSPHPTEWGLDPAPRPAYQGEFQRAWLLAVQLYSIRSSKNWGHGDFSDLASLLRIVADIGCAGVGLNPLHATFYDRPGTGSPYSPSSRQFLNPLYIDVEAIDEFGAAAAASFAETVEHLRSAEFVDYLGVARAKLAALRLAHRQFIANGSPARRADFDQYCSEMGPDLSRFASFESLRANFSGPWWEWPAPWRTPNDEALRQWREQHAKDVSFHEYVQWNADRQLRRCADVARAHDLPIGLYLDTAVGVDPAGADVWINQRSMLSGLSIGAPPDKFNPAGQSWGITGYNPHGLVAEDFEPFRQMLRAGMRHAGALRLDHVLGLMRLFVIPQGLGADRGVYLRYPLASMLAAVAEESRRHHCIVIGEDLGTVEESFRGTLAAWGVWSYLVLLFERHADGSFKRPSEYPESAVATFGTHDLPTFAGWMSGSDLELKQALGIDPGESIEERQSARNALAAAFAVDKPTFLDAIVFLAETPTRLLAVSIEDVLEIPDQVNIPGTVDQHPNWRRRLPQDLAALAEDERLLRVAEVMARAGRSALRTPRPS
jgi:4-alpha-glucanotransferase